MSIRNGLVFAMEEDNIIAAGGSGDVSETAAQVEAGSAQVSEQAGEIDDLQAAIEDATDGAETLGQVEGVLEKTAETGDGVDETAAEVAEIAVESICNRLGIRGKRVFPALESFGSRNTRLSATKVALETVKETIIRIWEAIRAAITRVLERIKSFFIGLIKSTAQLGKHIEDLMERSKKFSETAKPDREELDNKSLAKTFSLAKKADLSTAKQLVVNANKVLDETVKLTGHSENFSNAIIRITGRLEDGQDLAKAKQSFEANIASVLNSLGKVAAASGDKAGEKTEEFITYYGPFVGTRVIAYKKKTVTTGTDSEDQIAISVTTYDAIEADKIGALKRDEIYELLKEGLSLVDSLLKHEKAQGAKGKVSERLRKVADEILSDAKKSSDDDKSGEKDRILKQVQRDVNGVNGILTSLSVDFPSIVFYTAKGIADYATASMSNLKVPNK